MTMPETVRWRQEAPSKRSAPAPETPKRSLEPSQQARLVLLSADLLAALCGLSATLLVSERLVQTPGAWLRLGLVPLVFALSLPAFCSASGLYQPIRWISWRRQASAGLRALAWMAGVSVLALFLFAHDITVALRLAFGLSHAFVGVWLLALRPGLAKAIRRHVDRTAVAERILMLGADPIAREVARNISRSTLGVQIVGFASDDRPTATQLAPFYRTPLQELPALARDLRADLVVMARPDLPREDVVLLSDQLVADGIRVQVVSNVFNQLVDSVPFETVNGVPLVPVGQTPLRGGNERWKRIFDLVATTAGGLLILPLLAVIALLVKLSSPGPVLYRQVRIGKGGRPFAFFKFRSMRPAEEDAVHRDYARELVRSGDAAATDENGKKIYKLVDGSRVTPIGGFLRRTSLDELPQLLNVLRGEMSLVGPRPCLAFEYDLYKDWQKRRLDVTPGMTGLWQVTGRSYVTFEDMVLLDLFYIANWSFWMDVKILLRTVPVVIFGKGGL